MMIIKWGRGDYLQMVRRVWKRKNCRVDRQSWCTFITCKLWPTLLNYHHNACRCAWNVSIQLFPCRMQNLLTYQNLIVYHYLCKSSLLFIAEYTEDVARTHFILTVVTQGHTNLLLHNLHERQTMQYCFDSCCFHVISVLPLRVARNFSVFIRLPSYI